MPTEPFIRDFERQEPYRLDALDEVLERWMRESLYRQTWFSRAWTFDVPSWEERLASAIEERRLRHAPRRAKAAIRLRWRKSRWPLVLEAVRDKHYCPDDYR